MAKIKVNSTGALVFISTIACAVLVLAVSVFGRDATPEQRSFMKARVRLVARDTQSIPGHVINVYRRGLDTWCETNRLVVANAAARYRVSKLKLIVNLKAIGEWAVVKDFIASQSLKDEWDACQYIDTRYPAFIAATNQAVRLNMATSEDISRVLEKSWDD